jgi:hypothetical protein
MRPRLSDAQRNKREQLRARKRIFGLYEIRKETDIEKLEKTGLSLEEAKREMLAIDIEFSKKEEKTCN